MIFKFGELFCGPGGLGLAASNAFLKKDGEIYKIQHVWATDYDPDSCKTYRRNICPEEPDSVVCADIRTLDISTLKSISEIDALAFGFPCNDFSVVGEQKGFHGEYGPLYTYGARTLQLYQPKWFLAENVGGLRNANEGKAFGKILEDFYNAGYSVYPNLYKFDQYGVPQSRQRVIIVGIRNDLDVVYRVPATTPYQNIDNTAKTAIEVPPIPANAPNNEYTKQSSVVIKRLQFIKPGENAFTANLPEEFQLNVKGAKISQIYKRLDPKKPSYTITGSGGGGTHVYHWEEDRALTNRERARLQTFPDDFVFEGSKESVRKQIGMAVPPKGVQIIFESLLKCFAGEIYETVDCNIRPLIQPKHQVVYNMSSQKEQYTIFEKRMNYKPKN